MKMMMKMFKDKIKTEENKNKAQNHQLKMLMNYKMLL
jgi:hypothetical protein